MVVLDKISNTVCVCYQAIYIDTTPVETPDALVIHKTLSLSAVHRTSEDDTTMVWISLSMLPFTKWGFIEFLYFQIRELVPESQAYMDLLAFERKLDQTIMRKRVDIQEALKRPMKVDSYVFWISRFRIQLKKCVCLPPFV